MPERRQDLRAIVRLEVEPGGPGLKRPPFYVASNISASGIFLITSDPLPEKTRLKLQFQIPGDSEKIQVLAEVVWCREHKEHPQYLPGMGLKFIVISEEHRSIIERFVKESWEEQEKRERESKKET